MNGGEILGQADLNRCPLTAANLGTPEDAFFEADQVAPVGDLARLVVTRGGDYFFAPGIAALTALADGETFPPDAIPFDGHSIDDAFVSNVDSSRAREFQPIDAVVDYVLLFAILPPALIVLAVGKRPGPGLRASSFVDRLVPRRLRERGASPDSWAGSWSRRRGSGASTP